MTKQVSLSDRAYARLRRCRLDGESFSATVERLIDGQSAARGRFADQVARLHWNASPEERMRRIEEERDATREAA